MNPPLQTLITLAEQERDAAMAVLLQAEDASRRLRQQWQQLQTYHADYAARAPGLGGRTAPIDALRSHHAFMQRLDQALTQQQGLLQAADQRLAQQRQTLLALETRVASVRKLCERRQHDAQRSADRLDERQRDESAMQRHWRDSTAGRSVSH